ncbi:magnesium/cobalt transporter CorA [Zophobihabitans entericus]|uniref:Magnesium transport protein CorA n=1 Tax=Zophobihabitans entericus TaxID=1635327 RepID=A0A6G9IAH2_9GAMM|nr:magnesium/cobalt transporter CorA [Zophobihabitans entericus]QIQ21226.1 magnesium/cobalt transporter CorA [Zophobihabitans entericus]
MLNAFQLKNRQLSRLSEDEDLKSATWIDLVEPEEDDRHRVYEHLGQNLATSIELDDIEASARFFEDKDGLHIHSFFFFEDAEDHAGNSTVAFTIRDDRLFTLRERELPAFRLYRMRSRYQKLSDGNAYEVLLDLFETKVEQLADEIENIYSKLEELGRVIMKGSAQEGYDEAISTLAELEDIGWKVRLCLMDSQRALNYLIRRAKMPGDQLEQAREVIRDIESLIPHNESLFQKVNFLMQAAMGFINIEQSRIIKIFSVVSVVFLPPTVVASAYGMNFDFMPETHWKYGYPFAIALMLMAALAPYIYFKIKKWL